MHPVLFRVFGFPIHSYGVMLAVAFLSAIYVASRKAKALGENPDHISNMSIWVLVLSMIGARLFHVLVFRDSYRNNLWQAFNFREGGLVFYGGFIGGVLGAMIYFHRHKLNKAMYADIVAPTVALGLGFARIGCTLAGCCHGSACPASFPFGITFPKETVGISGVPLYPTQPVESFLSFGIFFILYFLVLPRKKYHGQVIAWFLILYGVMRSALEFFRHDPRGFVGLARFSGEPGLAQRATGFVGLLFSGETLAEITPGAYQFRLSESQVVSLVLFAVAAAIFVFLPKRLPVVNISKMQAPSKALKPVKAGRKKK